MSWKNARASIQDTNILSWRTVWEQLSPFSRTSEVFKCPNRVWAPKMFTWISLTVGICLYILGQAVHPVLAQSCPTLRDPMDCSTPGLPVHHQLPELAQTHVHWIGDAIQPSHPLSSPSPALNLSQHQGLFKWVSSSHQVAKVLELQLPMNWKESVLPMNIQGWFPLGLTGLISLQSKGLSSLLQHHNSKASIL